MKISYSAMTTILQWRVALLVASAWGLSGCGGSGSASPAPVVTPPVVTTPVTPPVIPPVVSAPSIRLLSGDLGGSGNIDGIGTLARFSAPQGLASDAAGNVYAADKGNATIRKISSTGAVSTLAGSPGLTGQVDGTGAAARFTAPEGIVSDAGGTLWVTDGNRVRKVTPSGIVTTLVDTGGALSGLARDATGQLYASAAGGTSVLKITTTPEGISTFVDIGVVVPGRGVSSSGTAVDAQGNIYVTSSSTHSVRKITPAGAISTFAGLTNGLGASTTIGAAVAQMSSPSGIAIDAQGNVVVTDASDYVRTINPAGLLVSVLQMPPKGGVLSFGLDGITVDSSGRPMVVSKNAIYTPGASPVLAEFAGHNSLRDYSTPFIAGFGANATGGIYFIEKDQAPNGQLRSASAEGVVATIGPRNLQYASVFAVSPSGDVYSAFTFYENGFLTRTEKGGAVEKLASNGTRTVVWTSASQVPLNIQLDGTGDLHLQYRPVRSCFSCSAPPPAPYTIAKIDGSNAVLSTVAAYSQGGAAYFKGLPFAIDPAGGYFVGDSHAVFKVSATGQVTLVAGSVNASGAADGTGSAARFNDIASLAVDGAGNVLVADQKNHAIRKITPSGVVTTVVGQFGKVGGSVGTLPGTLELPDKVMLDAKGVLYIGAKDALLRVQFP